MGVIVNAEINSSDHTIASYMQWVTMTVAIIHREQLKRSLPGPWSRTVVAPSNA